MKVQLDLNMQAQPTGETCGPTCLHALYRFYGDPISLEAVIAEVPSLPTGGTLGVILACHALRRGYRVRIYSYNLNVFDPTWFGPKAPNIQERLKAQQAVKEDSKLRTSTRFYLEYLELGGDLRFEDLTKALIRKYLNRSQPILTGLSATYMYRSAREFGPNLDYDDVRGEPLGHFVILSGYDRARRTVQIADPLLPNPVSLDHYYEVNMDRLIGAVFLGILTYDANLIVIQPR
ncbi:MAG: C39 family peptidase [Verrucomicrobia bacterium]|nr:C39 family peptidase [Verrucomicrobiota bacterium]